MTTASPGGDGPTPSAFAGLRILLVEDDDRVRRSIRKALQRLGCTVSEAANGRSARRTLRDGAVELVVTDLFMPDMDGLELIMEIRLAHPEVKIMAISGGGRAVSMDLLPVAKRLGADCVLAKPFDVRSFVAKLRALGL